MATKPLNFVVDMTLDGLKQRTRDVKAVFGDIGATADQTIDRINAAFRKRASGDNTLSVIQQNQKAFNDLVRQVESAGQLKLKGFDQSSVAGIRQAADELERFALEQKLVADGARNVVAATDAERLAINAVAGAYADAGNRQLEQVEQMRLTATVYERMGIAGTAAADHVVSGHQRMGIAGMELQHVIRATGDSFAAGLPPATIFAEQLGRVAEAASLMGGDDKSALGKFGAFMGGPWGLAIGVGVSVLVPLIANMDLFHDKLGEAEKKLRDQADAERTAAEAGRAFDSTLEGMIASEKKLNDELTKEIANQRDLKAARAGSAEQTLGQLQGTRESAKVALQRALENLDQAGRGPANGEAGRAGRDAQIASAERAVKAAREQLDTASNAVLNAETTARKALIPVLQDQARAANDPKLAAKNRFEDQQTALGKQLELGTISADQYRTAFAKLQAQIDALGKKDGRGPSAGSVNALGGMEALLRSMGFVVAHTTDGKHVAGSEHYTGHAIDFVPKGGMGSVTKAEVEQMLEDAGVKFSYGTHGVKQFFGPGDKGHSDHFHVGFTGSPNPESADRVQEAAQRRAAAAVERAARDDEALNAAYASAAQDRAQAMRRGAHSIEEQAELDRQEVAAKLEQRLISNAKLKREHSGLDAIETVTASLEADAVTAEEMRQLRLRELDTQGRALQLRGQLLGIEGQMADTLKERRRIGLAQIDNERDQQVNAATAAYENSPKDAAATAAFNTARSSADTLAAANAGVVRQQTQGPLADYFDQLKKNTGDWNEILDGVQAKGLKGIEDGLLGVIQGTESAATAFKQMTASILADLARIALEKVILSVFGLKDGGPVGVPGFATGGFVSGPGGPRDDRIPAMLSNGEFVMNAAAVKRYGPTIKAMNDGALGHFASGGVVGYPSIPNANDLRAPTVIHQHFTLNAPGALMLPEFVAGLNQRIAAVGQAAVMGGAGLARQQIADDGASRFP